jgi:hypothetical protein
MGKEIYVQLIIKVYITVCQGFMMLLMNLILWLLEIEVSSQVLVVHACNPSYVRG